MDACLGFRLTSGLWSREFEYRVAVKELSNYYSVTLIRKPHDLLYTFMW